VVRLALAAKLDTLEMTVRAVQVDGIPPRRLPVPLARRRSLSAVSPALVLVPVFLARLVSRVHFVMNVILDTPELIAQVVIMGTILPQPIATPAVSSPPPVSRVPAVLHAHLAPMALQGVLVLPAPQVMRAPVANHALLVTT
jgi:hypothetical protein